MSSNDKVIKNFLWRFFERCGAQGVSFVVQIVLARILAPDVYGTIALITVFTTILQVFVDSGMGNALIQKKNADNLDFSSVFYFNIVVCIILYICMFFAAPLIAVFYENNELVPVIRVLSLTLVISGIKNVQQAYVSRTMQFKKFFFSTLAGTIGAAIIGIALAYNGFGVWALVAQQIFNATLDTIVLWITVKWRPEKKFSLKRLKGLFSYGWKLLASSLLNQIYSEITTLIIGKVYTTTDLAQYNRGNTFPMFIINNVNSSIDSVLLIYDAAHAFAVKYKGKSSACFGDASMFSFHATKVFNTIEGGCVCYKNDAWVQLLNDQKNFGIHSEEEVAYIGGNAKMNEFQAAMGICNMRHLDEEIKKREIIVNRYRERLLGVEGIKLSAIQKNVESNYAYFPVIFDGYKYTRNEVFEKLAEHSINARKYFYPLTNSFECYRNYPTAGTEKTPIAQHIALRVLTLPLYADLALEEVDRICDIILN